jgi:hypothetical protein
LQVLTGDVERKIFRVNNTLDEAEVFRDEVLAVIHDEHAADVELDVVLLLLTTIEHVHRGALGGEEERFEGKLTFDREVLDGKVVFPVVGHGLVEGAVLFILDFLGVTSPEGLGLVEEFPLGLGFSDLLGLLLLGLADVLVEVPVGVGGEVLALGELGGAQKEKKTKA